MLRIPTARVPHGDDNRKVSGRPKGSAIINDGKEIH